jgi:hypothetical protein
MTKKETKEAFDLNKALDEVQKPSFFVEGFKAYIENNNLKISNMKDFEKSLKEFGELSL